MKASSSEYLRGAECARRERETGADLGFVSEDPDFHRGYHDQIKEWPERIDSLPPYYLDLDHAEGNMAVPCFIGAGVFCAGLAAAGFKWLPGPAVGGLLIVSFLAFVAAYRNTRP